ncbi:MAG: hypothetical protein ACLUG1_00440 [Christensenellales bacterium]
MPVIGRTPGVRKFVTVTVVLPVEGETTLPPLHSVRFLRSRV